MYVYLRAALRGTRQHGGWKGGNSPALAPPPGLSSSRYLLSSYSIFTHCTGSLSLSFHPMFIRVTCFIFSLSPSVSLFVSALSYRFYTSLTSPCPFSLSSFLVPSFVSMHLVSLTAATPIRCCCYVVAADETSRCTHICVQKKRTPRSVKHKGEYLS